MRDGFPFFMVGSQFQTSFLPKQTIARQLGGTQRRRGAIVAGGVGTLIASTIFFLTVAGAATLFVLERQTTAKLENARKILEEKQSLFSKQNIEDIVRTYDRYRIATQLLQAHIAPSLIFPALAAHTLATVQFTDFAYRYAPDNLTLTLKARGEGYASVALQADALAPQPGSPALFSNPVVGDLKEEEDGSVSFSLTVSMPAAAISFAHAASALSSLQEASSTAEGSSGSVLPEEGAAEGDLNDLLQLIEDQQP